MSGRTSATTEELEVFPNRTFVVPFTGEVVSVDDLDALARVLNEARVAANQLNELKRVVTGLLVDHSVQRGERTFLLPGGVKAVREGGPVKQYDDPHGLERELLAAGMPADRVSTIVVTTIDKKVSGVEAAKAARSNPEYASIIGRHERVVDKPYSIKLG